MLQITETAHVITLQLLDNSRLINASWQGPHPLSQLDVSGARLEHAALHAFLSVQQAVCATSPVTASLVPVLSLVMTRRIDTAKGHWAWSTT